jgi:putative endonuclease
MLSISEIKMTESNKQLGTKGEQLSAAYLEKIGHKIIKRNYRSGRYEIDIISLDHNILVFSEVKSNYKKPLADNVFRINKSKKNSIINGAYRFIDIFPEYSNMDIRFDVLIADFSQFPAKIEHYEAAFWQDRFW